MLSVCLSLPPSPSFYTYKQHVFKHLHSPRSQAALQQYRDEVVSGAFPSPKHTPYRIPQPEVEILAAELRRRGSPEAAKAVEDAAGWEKQG